MIKSKQSQCALMNGENKSIRVQRAPANNKTKSARVFGIEVFLLARNFFFLKRKKS